MVTGLLIQTFEMSILPMVHNLTRERIVVPSNAGKAPIGVFGCSKRDRSHGRNPTTRPEGMAYGSHSNVEWVIGISGKAELALNGQRYDIDAGDLAIIPSNCPHLERISNLNQPYHLLWFCVYPQVKRIGIFSSVFNGEKDGSLQFVRGAQVNHRADICRVIERSAEEAVSHQPAWESRVQGLALIAMVDILRHLQEHGTGFMVQQHKRNAVDAAKAYIHANMERTLTLKQIAQATFLSPAYLSTLFSRTLGSTVFQYVQQVRINEAMRLLSETERPIKELALRVGFNSRSHFLRAFKKQAGCSPQAYRKRTASSSDGASGGPGPAQ